MADHAHPLIELSLARLRELIREPSIIFWVFGFPILISIALGVAFRESAPAPAEVAVVGADDLAARLDADERLVARAMSPEGAREALRKNRVDLILELATPTSSRAIYRFDPARPESVQARLVADAVFQRARGRADAVAVADEPVSERGSRYIDFLIPGMLGLNLMGSSMWGIGFAVVEARSRKLMKRFAATPMRRSYYLLSFALTRFMLLAVELVVLLAFGALAFDVTVRGSYLDYTIMAALGASSFAGIALLVAARPRAVEVASGWMNFVMMPMWILSGAFFSYERFPEVMHPLIEVLPLTALIDGLRAISTEGATLGQLGGEITVLAVWGALTFALALRWFRWQ